MVMLSWQVQSPGFVPSTAWTGCGRSHISYTGNSRPAWYVWDYLKKGREGGRKKDRSYTFPVLPPLWNIHKGFQTFKKLHLLSFFYILQNTFYILKFVCVSWLPSDYELSLTLCFRFTYFMFVGVLPTCMSIAPHACNALGSLKRSSESLGLQRLVS